MTSYLRLFRNKPSDIYYSQKFTFDSQLYMNKNQNWKMRNCLRNLLTPELAISVIIYLLFLNYVIRYFSKATSVKPLPPKSALVQVWDSMLSVPLSSIVRIFIAVLAISSILYTLINKRYWISPRNIKTRVGGSVFPQKRLSKQWKKASHCNGRLFTENPTRN